MPRDLQTCILSSPSRAALLHRLSPSVKVRAYAPLHVHLTLFSMQCHAGQFSYIQYTLEQDNLTLVRDVEKKLPPTEQGRYS